MYNKNFDTWNKYKKATEYKIEKELYFYEREIWYACLGVNIGSEIDGKNKDFERPVLILRKVSNTTAFAIPMTSRYKPDKDDLFRFKFEGVNYQLSLGQARLISRKRLLRKVNTINHQTFNECRKAFIDWLIKNDSRSFLTGISEPEGHSN